MANGVAWSGSFPYPRIHEGTLKSGFNLFEVSPPRDERPGLKKDKSPNTKGRFGLFHQSSGLCRPYHSPPPLQETHLGGKLVLSRTRKEKFSRVLTFVTERFLVVKRLDISGGPSNGSMALDPIRP